MKKGNSNIIPILGIVVLVLTFGFATYSKLTYTSSEKNGKEQNEGNNQNLDSQTDENNNNNTNPDNEQDPNDQTVDPGETDPETSEQSLKCHLMYFDELNSQANIREDITINFNSDNKAISQDQKIDYSFEDEQNYTDAKTFFESQGENIDGNFTYDDTLKNIIRKISNNYQTPKDETNDMDFRNITYDDVKQQLTDKNFTCN